MQISDAKSLLVTAGVGIVVGLVAWVAIKGVKGAARAAAGVAVDTVGSVIAGTVEGVGQAVGVPITDRQRGLQDIKAGDWWAASFDLPATDFMGAVWDRVTGGDGTGGMAK